MKYLSLLWAALHAIACTQAQPIEPRTVTITVQLLHPTPATSKAFVVHFTNPFERSSVAVETDAKGQLIAKGELAVPQNTTVRYNDHFINLWLHPGDSVHLEVDAARLSEQDFAWLTIQGDRATISTQLNKAHQYMASLKDPHYDWQQTPAGMLAAIKSTYQQKKAAYDAYAKGKALDPFVRTFMAADLLYSISNNVTDYIADSLPMQEKAARIAIFRDTLFGLYEASNFQSMMFAYHLGWYAHWLTELDSTVSQHKKAGRYAEAAHAGISILQQEPPGLSRDYMIYSFLQGICLKEPPVMDLLPGYAPMYSQAFVPASLQRSLERSLATNFPVKTLKGMYYLGAGNQEQALPATDVVAWLRKQYAGKVVYVDVYATWCGPCREELPYIPTLQANYKGLDLVFVNLCVQDRMKAWKQLVQKKQWGGEHYYLDADASKLFMGHYRAAGVPVYWLIDRQGKLVTTNAPRPSEGKRLEKQLEQLLK